jgi:hypothetical protein
MTIILLGVYRSFLSAKQAFGFRLDLQIGPLMLRPIIYGNLRIVQCFMEQARESKQKKPSSAFTE